MNKVNVYDFDKTIIPYDSTQQFIRFLLRRKPSLIFSLAPRALALGIYAIKIISKTRAKEIVYGFLKNVPDINSEVKLFWEQSFGDINLWYINSKKADDIIISASPDFLLRPVAEKLNVRLIASLVNSKTGKTTGENCYGAQKVIRLNAEYPGTDISEFYSDSLSDSPLAELSDKAFLVSGSEITPWPAN
ncbi:MAG: phosphoserine phosphatase [Ruminococcaceae bacterium]|nr:phosphoserine phosphatase [Oscillospiraceae bacterium]